MLLIKSECAFQHLSSRLGVETQIDLRMQEQLNLIYAKRCLNQLYMISMKQIKALILG